MSRDLCIMACVFCRDPKFLEWVTEQVGSSYSDIAPPREAKEFILDRCGIDSRAKLDIDKAAADRFHKLIREPFLAWREQL